METGFHSTSLWLYSSQFGGGCWHETALCLPFQKHPHRNPSHWALDTFRFWGLGPFLGQLSWINGEKTCLLVCRRSIAAELSSKVKHGNCAAHAWPHGPSCPGKSTQQLLCASLFSSLLLVCFANPSVISWHGHTSAAQFCIFVCGQQRVGKC